MVMVDLENGNGIHQNGHCFVTLFLCFVCVSGKFRCAKNNQLTTGERTEETPLLHRNKAFVIASPCPVSRVSRAPRRVLSCLVVRWVVVCPRSGTSVK